MIADIIAFTFAAAGTALILVAAIGIVRMPDLLMRMHASSKAGTLGAVLILIAVAVSFADTAIVMRVTLIVLFLFLTAPLSAHLIARAGYCKGTPACDETVVDQYADRDAGPTPLR
ncbi:MAG: monovalent cation/H(+) antiporter subunit G [Acidobacteriota bacterium]|nr:monovalent cation/H(+) antiporter subunit G [Acidobacteriota bacterium]